MKIEFRLITAALITAVLLSSVVSQAARSHSLDEDAALDLLARTLKHDHVYAKRISLGCITYDTEETTDAYFQFAPSRKARRQMRRRSRNQSGRCPLSRSSSFRQNREVGSSFGHMARL
jgi:hypothetical protein